MNRRPERGAFILDRREKRGRGNKAVFDVYQLEQ